MQIHFRILKQLKRTYIKASIDRIKWEIKIKKKQFSKGCKPFSLRYGELMYNKKRLVISSTERQQNNN